MRVLAVRINALGGSRIAERAALHLTVAGVLAVLLFPIYWILVTSLKTPAEAFRLPPTFWPQTISFEAYPFMIQAWQYWRTLANTLIVAGAAALIATILGGSAAYAFHRARFPGRSLCFGFLVVSLALPGMVTIGPIFLAYTRFNLIDTLHGLVLVNVSNGLPLAMLTLYAYLGGIPRDLDDAALTDGCNRLQLLRSIIVPLAAPGLVVSFLLVFIAVWNEFLAAFILTVTPEARLLNVRLVEVPVRETVQTIPYDLISAGGILCLLPLVPILILARRRLVEGILAGALRG